MRCRLPTCAMIALVMMACGSLARTETVANVTAPGVALLRASDQAGNETRPVRAELNGRPDRDRSHTGSPAVTPTNNLAAAQSGGFNPNIAGPDGGGSNIFTVGGKPLLAAAGAPEPEQKGLLATLSEMTPKGVPALAMWALIAIGIVMIGVAVRGLLLANRRLARLRSEDEE